jgi:ElaB/YqjD/DUF883 family membrane-anchored ribosome-binding protein
MAKDDRERDTSGTGPLASPAGALKSGHRDDRKELDSLKGQVRDLTAQTQEVLSHSTNATLRRAGDAASEMISGVSAKSREAMEGVQEVKDNLAGAIDASLKNRPYTTLAVAFGLGFLFARLR